MLLVRRWFSGFILFTFILAVLELPLAFSQPAENLGGYRVGPGDRIFLSVPQRPDLNRDLLIKEGGIITLPLIGDVNVGGMNSQEIEQKLLQSLRDYYPSITSIKIDLTQAVSQIIYVSGEINNPGKYNFTVAPNVWEAIREAGGPTPTASMDNVRIIKDRSRGGTSIVVNVQAAMEGGSVDDLPDLEAGDTIIIPARAETYTGTFGVNVFGSVLRPGVYRLQARQDLISAVLMAGGPLEVASLGDIKIIRPRTDGTVATVRIDLNKFLDAGEPYSNPKLQPGDTIYVPRQGRLTQLFKSDVGLLLNLVTAAVTVTALVITVRNNSGD